MKRRPLRLQGRREERLRDIGQDRPARTVRKGWDTSGRCAVRLPWRV